MFFFFFLPLARKLASPFSHPAQVSTRVQFNLRYLRLLVNPFGQGFIIMGEKDMNVILTLMSVSNISYWSIAFLTSSQLALFCLFISDTKHVMISYQWDVQTLVIQLKNKLQADGYKVWMDIDEMGGSTLESMAKAVENASVVLVCVSQKYKESPNCRSGTLYNI